MERTGHRSIEGVRSYKRTSDTQREALSNILNNTKTPRLEEQCSTVQLYDGENNSNTADIVSTTTQVGVPTVNKQTNMKNIIPGTFNFAVIAQDSA